MVSTSNDIHRETSISFNNVVEFYKMIKYVLI